eukprot:TRINITY_DN4565_c0_g2_i1.p1 TRINITY_DN4565_c0_g2~~TRINITY_DN4565_c0_g2_i1.p1  ORF type:complete len:499 (+),score=161.19 TRINITY_DN4565_c0_g2_i1:1935-3431(+)
MVEEVQDPETTQKRRRAARDRMEDIMDKAIDMMLHPSTNDKEGTMESQMMRSLLAFGDINDVDILVQEDKESLITAADIGTLIHNLTEAKEDFVDQFLITFRYFISPGILLNKLILKYIACSKDNNGIKIRQQLTKVFRIWIRDHYYDFDVDPELQSIMSTFVEKHAVHLQKLWAKQSEIVVPEGMEEIPKKISKSTRFLNIFKRKSQLENFDAVSTAHQLTLMVFNRFKMIKPLELHAQSWSKENKAVTSPNVVALVDHFNRIANLFTYEIVSQFNLKKRIQVVKHVISIGWAAYNYRDYETTFTVVLSLSQFIISRLSDTWKGLPATFRQQWEILEQFCDHKDNYKNYRSQLRKHINMMPYMGLFLKDLTNIDENDTITAMGAINFFKMRKVAQVISTIQRAQQSIFNFQKNLKISSFIQFEVPTCDENELWEMSLQCEKQGDGESLRMSSLQMRLTDILSPTPLVTTSSNPIFGLVQRTPSLEKRRSDTSNREIA